MKKFGLMILIILLALPLFGCSQNTSPALSDVEADLIASGETQGMIKADGKALKRFYGLNISDFEEVAVYSPSNYMDVSEMLIIKSKDVAQLDLIEIAIDTRVAKQLESFSGYGPEQCALLENYEIKIIGNTLFYCVSPDAANLKNTFKKSMKN
ncbi:DUF4358 domain-containing protein [Acetobacterium bakii]|uniref:DUF4358 domain-containing protein n=1 Tax=Acetobacterium bakii TaxID=52689 RepID=A0A0L6U2Z7_9FIRM|nr:DUF4358 domain-containing protein [Acetobacterium bakii]KNZ42878.1 hypothetical protein AKG39_03915 [Acetobacterium bakii]